jgi:hypothetical protein
MLDDLRSMADLHLEYCLAREDDKFLVELRRTVSLIRRDARPAAILWELSSEANAIEALHCERETHQLAEVPILVTRIVNADKTLDTTCVPRPAQGTVDVRWHRETLAAALAIADGLLPGDKELGATASLRALKILETICASRPHIDANNAATPVGTVWEQVLGSRNSAKHSLADFSAERDTHPGFALRAIDEVIALMNPAPGSAEFTGYGDPLEFGGETLRLLTRELRVALERLRHGLRLRIGIRRSLATLFGRYRTRCEWHDRDRQRKLAKAGKGKPEDKLCAEMARWLFDQGLNPISTPATGKLRPDLFDPSRRAALYVEAKQYKGTGGLSALKSGIRQVETTAPLMSVAPYLIEEAFLAVFCRGGELVRLDQPVDGIQRPGYRLFVEIIDLAEVKERGSRASRAVRVVNLPDLLV